MTHEGYYICVECDGKGVCPTCRGRGCQACLLRKRCIGCDGAGESSRVNLAYFTPFEHARAAFRIAASRRAGGYIAEERVMPATASVSDVGELWRFEAGEHRGFAGADGLAIVGVDELGLLARRLRLLERSEIDTAALEAVAWLAGLEMQEAVVERTPSEIWIGFGPSTVTIGVGYTLRVSAHSVDK